MVPSGLRLRGEGRKSSIHKNSLIDFGDLASGRSQLRLINFAFQTNDVMDLRAKKEEDEIIARFVWFKIENTELANPTNM